MNKFAWMIHMAAQIPSRWGVTLEPIAAGETIVGPLPEELTEPFMMAMWAKERADVILEAHLVEDRTLGSNRPECVEAEIASRDLRHRSEILLAAVIIGIKEVYHLAYAADVKIRYEGVAVMERRGHTVLVVPRSDQ